MIWPRKIEDLSTFKQEILEDLATNLVQQRGAGNGSKGCRSSACPLECEALAICLRFSFRKSKYLKFTQPTSQQRSQHGYGFWMKITGFPMLALLRHEQIRMKLHELAATYDGT